MATTNPTVTATWSEVVALGSDFFLSLPFSTRYDVEIATTDGPGTAPTVVGHVLSGDAQEVMSRALIGPGTVWARTRSGSTTLVVNASTTPFTPTAAQAQTAVQPNTPTQLGGTSNYVEVLADGTVRLVGTATVWDDITPGIAAARTSGSGVSLNLVEMTLDYVATADTNDYAVIPFQLLHAVKAGSSVYMHVHWEQASANTPNWLFQYRWQRQGQAKTTAWTNLKSNTNAFTYVSGTLDQISYGAGIAAPANYGISDILQVRLIRDTGNTSTLFTGADPYSGTVSATSFDPHVEKDALGSASEYVK